MFTSKPNYYKTSEILERISQEDVFSEYLGIYPDLNKWFRSPFRSNDKNPGCRFKWHSGILYFVENSMFNKKLYWTCIDVVQYVKKCNYREALDILYKRTPSESKIITETAYSFTPDIRFEKQTWHEPNLFMLTGDMLEKELVFKVKNYWIKNKHGWQMNNIHHPSTTLVVAYYFPDSDHVKLYFPEKKEFRWYSNCDIHDIFGWDKLSYYKSLTDKLVISKSAKDRLVLDYLIGVPNIALQNEGCHIPDDKLFELGVMFPKITFLYDNDLSGIIQSQKLSELYKYEYKIIDTKEKDPYEMVQEFGIENTKKLIL